MSEEIDAGAEFVRQFNTYEPVKVAFWLKASDDPHRFLYIASEQIDDTNFDVAYGEVLRLVGRLRSPYLDPFRVKLVGAGDPLAMAAADTNQRFPGRTAIRFGGKLFGNVKIDDIYIYPSSLPVAT